MNMIEDFEFDALHHGKNPPDPIYEERAKQFCLCGLASDCDYCGLCDKHCSCAEFL